jgi:hypothetical protein
MGISHRDGISHFAEKSEDAFFGVGGGGLSGFWTEAQNKESQK